MSLFNQIAFYPIVSLLLNINSIIVVGDFSVPLSIMHRATRQKGNKEIDLKPHMPTRSN